jgi:hypothetical protein
VDAGVFHFVFVWNAFQRNVFRDGGIPSRPRNHNRGFNWRHRINISFVRGSNHIYYAGFDLPVLYRSRIHFRLEERWNIYGFNRGSVIRGNIASSRMVSFNRSRSINNVENV